MKVWLSKPIRTLSLPSLSSDEGGADDFTPNSVLLILGGTGIVALPQIIAHKDPLRMCAVARMMY
eukprot:11374693-Ditylum_brightwellii.AAC.1